MSALPSPSATRLKPGDRIRAEVIEVLSAVEMICAIEGRLLRVRNESGLLFKPGTAVLLDVLRVDPLELRMPHRQRGFDRMA